MFDIIFERVPWGHEVSEQKVGKPTISLIEKVLLNAGMDEGTWVLRLPRKIRKRRTERFRALRIDSSLDYLNRCRGGVRIRCKPGGNETSFEYTLVPPNEVDVEILFHILERVNPSSLEIYDTLILKTAISNPDLRDTDAPLFKKVKLIENYLTGTPNKIENKREDMNNQDDQKSIEHTSEEIHEKLSVSSSVVEKEIENSLQENSSYWFKSLSIDEPIAMSDQWVMDRALVAMSFVIEGGCALKHIVSNSIIENLKIKEYCENFSDGLYTTHQAAMRALTMALRKNNYITTNSKEYKLTKKGEQRIVKIYDHMSVDLKNLMSPCWNKTNVGEDSKEEEFEEKDDLPVEEQNEFEIQKEEYLDSQKISELKKLIESLEESNDQINEASDLIEDLISKKTDLSMQMTGLVVTISSLEAKKIEIDKEIDKLKDKESEIKDKISKKEKEIVDWQNFQSTYYSEKQEMELKISQITGRTKIA